MLYDLHFLLYDPCLGTSLLHSPNVFIHLWLLKTIMNGSVTGCEHVTY
jgi:hypothetical protein